MSECMNPNTSEYATRAANNHAGNMHVTASQLTAYIGKGGVLNEDSIYHLKATIAICEAALEGESIDPAMVYYKGVEA